MTQTQGLTKAEINWNALKLVLESDTRVYSALAARADHGPAGDMLRAEYTARVSQAQAVLDSMITIESL